MHLLLDFIILIIIILLWCKILKKVTDPTIYIYSHPQQNIAMYIYHILSHMAVIIILLLYVLFSFEGTYTSIHNINTISFYS